MPKKNNFLVATFDNSDSLLSAVHAVRQEQFRIYDVYAPYPVHGLDEAMGIRRTKLPLVTLVAGVSALAGALLFQFYTAVVDWNINIGGKPDNSTLAFIPITFELTVLLGALSTVFAFFIRARLYPGKKEQLIADGVTNNTFALVLRRRDASFNGKRAQELLRQSGAERIEEKEAEL